MEKVACTVERITFQNKENGYCVLKVRVKNIRNLITAVGTFPSVFIGSHLELTGVWKTDSKYGKQFQVSEWQETIPATVSGIEKYIGSELLTVITPTGKQRLKAPVRWSITAPAS